MEGETPTMRRTTFTRLTLAAVLAIAIASCSERTTTTSPSFDLSPSFSISGDGGDRSYVVLAAGNAVRAGMVAELAAAGAHDVTSLDAIGVIVARSSDPGFAAKAKKISGVSDVVLDQFVQWTQPSAVTTDVETDDGVVEPQTHGPTEVGVHETFRLVQWAPEAVHAPEAWAAGYQGAGARVAILDGGVNRNHIDIGPNLDVAVSKSFACAAPPPGPPPAPPAPPPPPPPPPVNCPNAEVPFSMDVGSFWHGTHVAGIVAAPANDVGTVGIAPRATLIGVKVLHNGSGYFTWIIRGIIHAATPVSEGGAGADIINMSLGAIFPRQGAGNAQLANAVGRATMYAVQRGVTVIAAAGNDTIDLDHTANIVAIPAQSPGVIAVSALAPIGWAVGSTDYDVPTAYTNFGQSAIRVAGPGGGIGLAAPAGTAVCSKPRAPGAAGPAVAQLCRVFDAVFAPFGAGNTSYGWATGTSMASPAVAGVAALIVGKANGAGQRLTPAQVRVQLERSANDLGKPGNDDFYGAGRVNALKAVQ
jgi:subtilisin family serine protease